MAAEKTTIFVTGLVDQYNEIVAPSGSCEPLHIAEILAGEEES